MIGSRTVLVTMILFLVAASGCSSRRSKNSETNSTAETKTGTRSATSNAGIDLNCVFDHIQNPPESFHYSYQKQSSNPVQEQADITPQSIDGSFTNASGTHTLHGVHSDASSWQMALSSLMGISGMSSAVSLVRNGSATVAEGPEKMNGYDTVKYSIDTSRGDPAEQGLYRTVLGKGGFEKGTAWVTAQGCPVKLVLDSELHGNDGSVEKIHYEEAMIRK